MSHKARGTFELTTSAEPPYDVRDGVSLGRFSFTKKFSGDLQAESTVQMLGARTPVPGSAGYVALERVIGTLDGRKGSFVLQHSGTRNRGASTLMVTVVPDSGAGELQGLAGTMIIDIVDGQHTYVFEYAGLTRP